MKDTSIRSALTLLLLFLLNPGRSQASEIRIGTDLWLWSDNFPPSQNATEWYVPISFKVDSIPSLLIYGSAESAVLSEINSYSYYFGPGQVNLSGLSNVVLGVSWRSDQGAARPFVNIGLDLPTGDGKLQVFQKELPVNLVDPRYFGASVTFGFNILGGIQLPNGDSSFEFGVGYMDPNAWNPTFDLPEGTYPITQSWDTFLVKAAWNQDLGNGREQKITLWGLYHDVIYSGNMPQFQLGPSLEASYQRQDPTGFSMKAGINIPTTNSYLYSGSTLSPEPYNGRGIRLYFDPTLGLGEVDLAVQTTLVLPNDYPQNSAGHISGGWVLGMMPTWKRPLDDTSSLVLRAGYSKVIAKDAALDSSFTLVDVLYDIFRFGAEYEFCF